MADDLRHAAMVELARRELARRQAMREPPPAEPQPSAGPDPGAGVSFGRGAAQGATLGFGDEVTGALQALATPAINGLRAAQRGDWKGAVWQPNSFRQMLDEYRASRDSARRENAEAQKTHGGAYLAGQFVGGTAPAVLTPGGAAGAGSKLLARVAQGAKTAAQLGAVSGLGGSEADLTRGDVGGAAEDTAAGGVVGGLTGGATSLVGGAAADALRKVGLKQGRRFLMSGAGTLSTREPVKDAAVEEALSSKAVPWFGTVKEASQRLEDLTTEQADRYLAALKEMEARGMHGPDALSLAMKIATAGKELEPNVMNEALPALYEREADKVLTKPAQGSSRLGLQQAESLKRDLQQSAKYGTREETPVNEHRRRIASMMRRAVEDEVQAQAGQAPELAASFVPTKQRLGRLIEAGEAADRGAAREGNRSTFGIGGEMSFGDPVQLLKAGLWRAARDRLGSGIARGAYGASQLPSSLTQALVPGLTLSEEEQRRQALLEALGGSQ